MYSVLCFNFFFLTLASWFLDLIRDLYLADFRLSQSAVQSVIQHQFNVSEIHLRFVLLRETDIREVIMERAYLET